MIYIVHGDDLVKSRNLILNQQKKLGIEGRIEIDISDASPEKVFDATHSSDLFGGSLYVVLNISKAGRTNLEPYLKAIQKPSPKTTIVIVSDKVLSQTNLFIKNAQKLGAKVVLNQKIPEGNTFRFVDALLSKQRAKTYQELAKLISQDQDPFETFATMLWGLRNVVHAKFKSPSFSGIKDFIKSKSMVQEKLYTKDSLVKIFQELSKIDKDSKTGVIESSMMLTLAVEKVLNS